MAKETRLKEAFLRYQEEGKWEYPDAFDLWTLGLDWREIAKNIRKRYDLSDDETAVMVMLTNEATELGLQSPKASTEDTSKEIGTVVNRLFDQYCDRHFKDIVKGRMRRLSRDAKNLLDFLVKTEGTLIGQGKLTRREHPLDDVKLAYKHVYGKELGSEIVDELIKAGIINENTVFRSSSTGKTSWTEYEWVASRYALPLLK